MFEASLWGAQPINNLRGRGVAACGQDTILRETQIMHEMRHPNVMPLYCSFVNGEQLWMIMPHVAGGSLFNVMQTSFPQVGLNLRPCKDTFQSPKLIISPILSEFERIGVVLTAGRTRLTDRASKQISQCKLLMHQWDFKMQPGGCRMQLGWVVHLSPPGLSCMQGLEEEIVATVALDVLRGLEYMHSHGMLHRDVKARALATCPAAAAQLPDEFLLPACAADAPCVLA
jgi:hypothetical protein